MCVSKDRQLQWAIPYFLELLYEDTKTNAEATVTPAQRRKALKKDFLRKTVQTQVQDWHAALWPAISFPEPLPTKTVKGESAGRMPERTCDTSVMMSTVASKLAEPNKRFATTLASHRFLKEVVTILARGSDFTVCFLELQRFGIRHGVLQPDGTLDGNLLWGGPCERVVNLQAVWRDRLALDLIYVEAQFSCCTLKL